MQFTSHSYCDYCFYLIFENETPFNIEFMPWEVIEEDKMCKDNFQSDSRENGFRMFFESGRFPFEKTIIRNI